MEDLQGITASGYTVRRLLGRGGSSSVWLVREERSGREFALKYFRPPARRSSRGAEMTEEGIRREIRIVSVLDHPHLIKAYDTVALAGAEGPAALIMEYAPGGSLAGLIGAGGKLSVGETVTVLTPIAQALAYLHGKGFTHGDVSPGNVLFTAHGKPMLSDVGIARMLGDPGSAAGAGTPGFLDPAPVDAVRAGLQPERDVYSVAALGWFCLTGLPPQRTADRPPLSLLLPEVPRELAAALESGLNEDRRLRPTAASLATAVYRSASPLPLDLAPAVHPTVLPELVTRLQAPTPRRLGERVHGLRRRMTTSKWSGPFLAAGKLPFSESMAVTPPAHPGDQGKGRHASPRGGRQVRRTALAGATAAAVAAAWWLSGAGVTAAGPDSPTGTAAGATTTGVPELSPAETRQQADPVETARQQAASPDPAVAVHGLAVLRSLALSTGKLELLDEVNQHGSAAAAGDSGISGRLRQTGRVLSGFSTTLSQVQAEEAGTEAGAVVAVTSASSAYEEKDAQGNVTARGVAGAEQRLRLVLVLVDGKWRVSDILPGT
ncbi:serine/threonine-protein kinase [Arthrobacter sp. Alg241-R88]|uniref:serine/threonine-protein kinase n=1 Tax=Arthrobacter sp. Alg241-R88 TaxID=2305984 RepID=UPI0013D63FB4|nr:serine/threonine-protein kinase [Arthrobacter sp. Alg241-R88]